MELKVGLKYTCRNNGPDWYGEITSIGTERIQVDFYENNLRTGSGSDPIEKVINYFETGYFKIKEDFVLPKNKPNYTKLINMLKYIDERNRTLT
jgi:hypothetical protein